MNRSLQAVCSPGCSKPAARQYPQLADSVSICLNSEAALRPSKRSGLAAISFFDVLAQAAEIALRQKPESITLDLLVDTAAAGTFEIPAEEDFDDVPS